MESWVLIQADAPVTNCLICLSGPMGV